MRKISILLVLVFMFQILSADITGFANTVVTYTDFENTGIFGLGKVGSIVNSGDDAYGNAMKISPNMTEDGWFYAQHDTSLNIGNTDYTQYIVSFDFNAKQTDHLYRFMIRGDEGYKWDKEYGDFAQIYWDEFGNLVFPINNNNFFTTNQTYAEGSVFSQKYEADKWYNVMLLVDIKDRWVSLYVDGECVVEKSTDPTHGKLFKAKHIFFGVQKGVNTDSILKDELSAADGSEELLIDNFKIAYNDPNAGFEVVQKGELYTNSSEIKLEASEIITKSTQSGFDNLQLINTETGEQINLGRAAVDKSNITIPLNKELADNTEYMIKLPENIETVTGKKLKSRYVYISAIAADTVALNEVIAEADFKDGGLNGRNITFEKEVNEAGIELKAVNKNGAVEFTSESFALWNKWPVIKFNITGDSAEASNKVIASFDAELRQEDSFAFRVCMYDTDGNEMSSEVFNANNYFVSLPYRGAPNAAACIEAVASTKYIILSADKFVKNAVNNVRYEYDRTTKIMSIYFNNKKVCDGTALTTTSGLVGSIRFGLISAHTAQGGFGSEADNVIVIDNIKVGYPKTASKKVTGFRILNENGDENGAMSDTALSNAAGGEIYLSAKADPSDITTDNIKIYSQKHNADITITEYDDTDNVIRFTFNEYLNKGEKYAVELTGIDADGGGVIAGYSSYFTVSDKASFELADFKLVNSSGAEITSVSDIGTTDSIYTNVVFKNTTDSDKTVIPYIAVYNEHGLSKLYRDKLTIPKNSGMEFSYNTTEKISAENISGTDVRIIAFITDGEGRLITDAIMFKNEGEITADDYSFNMEAEADGISLVEVIPNNVEYSNADKTQVMFADLLEAKDGVVKTVFKMKEDTATGFYTIYVNTKKAGESLYSNPTEAKTAISGLNASALKESSTALSEIEQTLTYDYLDLGIGYDFYSKIDKTELSELVLSSIKENNLSESDIGKAMEQVDKAVIMQAIGDGLVDNFLDYEKSLDLESSRVAEFTDESFCTDAFGAAVTDKLKNTCYKSSKEFFDKFYKEFVLQSVYRYNGIENVKKVVLEFSNEIGLKSVPDDSAYNVIAGKLYESYEKLCGAIEGSFSSPKPNGGLGGGSGSGGGAYSSGAVSQARNDNVQEEAQTIPQDIFTDLGGFEWARNSIVYLAEMGIINGKEEGKFYPSDNITREELVKILVEAFAENAEPAEIFFEDADKNMWYYPYLQSARGADIANGYSETQFGVGDLVTREDMALLVYNAAKYKNIIIPEVKAPLFFDDEEISDYAEKAIYCLYGNKVINGTGNGYFEPKGNATRAEAAKIVYSCLTY